MVWIICDVLVYNLVDVEGVLLEGVVNWYVVVVWKIGISYGYCDVWVVGVID